MVCCKVIAMHEKAMKESPEIVSARLASRDLDRAVGKRVSITKDRLIVELKDGRIISTPLKWYPRLMVATPAERKNVEIGAYGLSWPDLDEDLSYRGMLLGRRDQSNPRFLKFWRDNRKKGRLVTLEDFMKLKTSKRAGSRGK